MDDPRGTVQDAITASLNVGAGLGLLTREADRRWSLSDHSIVDPNAEYAVGWRPFRRLVLERICSQAVDAIASHQKPSDLSLAITWLMSQDVLQPLGLAFSDGAERRLGNLAHADGTLVKAVENSEQWRAFLRWTEALGLTRTATSSARGRSRVVVADASSALVDRLVDMPAQASAERWIKELLQALPILGEGPLRAALPTPTSGWPDYAPALALGMLKMEHSKRVALHPSDDARNVVAIGLGDSFRQVGMIEMLSRESHDCSRHEGFPLLECDLRCGDSLHRYRCSGSRVRCPLSRRALADAT